MLQPHNLEIQTVIIKLKQQYQNAVEALRNAIIDYAQDGKLPDIKQRAEGLFSYPQLTVYWHGETKTEDKTRAYGRLPQSGTYSTTITNPSLFENYLSEQLQLIADAYHATFEVSASKQEIPYPFVIDGTGIGFDRLMSASLAKYFPTTDLSKIGDEITDGLICDREVLPLSHFDALRTDFSLAQVHHLKMYNPIFYLQIIIAMLMNLYAGQVNKLLIKIAHTVHFLVLVFSKLRLIR